MKVLVSFEIQGVPIRIIYHEGNGFVKNHDPIFVAVGKTRKAEYADNVIGFSPLYNHVGVLCVGDLID